MFKNLIYNVNSGLVGELFVSHYSPTNNPKSQNVVYLFHGFPSWRNKNHDLAERWARLGYHVVLAHYRGLGLSEGTFQFRNSPIDMREIVVKFNKFLNAEKISMAGYSWGGFMCTHLSDLVNDKLLLMAPLVLIPKGDALRRLVKMLREEHPRETSNYQFEEMQNEIAKMGADLNYETAFKNWSNCQALITHGSKDNVIPIEDSKNIASRVSSLKLDIRDDDHALLANRRELVETVESFFK